jgi:hypothetical protein
VILRHPIPRTIVAIRPTCRRPVVYRHGAVVCEQHRRMLARYVREQRGQQDCWTWQRATMGRVSLGRGQRFNVRHNGGRERHWGIPDMQ